MCGLRSKLKHDFKLERKGKKDKCKVNVGCVEKDLRKGLMGKYCDV